MHPHPPTARPCAECDGHGTVVWKVCGHSGSTCPCAVHEAECEACVDGAVPCSVCGDAPATHWPDRWGICATCYKQEEARDVA